MGPNGAGKTTLLRVLATLVQPDAGAVHVAGYDRRLYPAQIRASVGFLGHATFLYRDLTPRENLRFYARLYQVPDAERRITHLLEELGAASWEDRRVGTLSNGMQKRVALARALLHQPRLLVLDEPEAGVDEQGRALLFQIVRTAAERGASVVMTTHSPEWGLPLADQVAVLTGGRIAFHAAAHTVQLASIQHLLGQRSVDQA
jgi:heme ABC exporter ATP-binding subunit CcmA